MKKATAAIGTIHVNYASQVPVTHICTAQILLCYTFYIVHEMLKKCMNKNLLRGLF